MSDRSEYPALHEQSVESLAEEYRQLGLLVGIFEDKPYEHTSPHAHEGAIIRTIGGHALMQLDRNGMWLPQSVGNELGIQDDQLHESLAGRMGWKYIFACTRQLAESQSILDRVS